MIKRIMMAAVLAIGVAGPAMAGQTSGADMAASLASKLQGAVGQKEDGGVLFAAVRAEGDTVIVTIDGTEGWHGVTPAQLTNSFLTGFCTDPVKAKAYFALSAIRIDTLEFGKNLQVGQRATACPAQ